jgi:hypothetical protein
MHSERGLNNDDDDDDDDDNNNNNKCFSRRKPLDDK